MMSAVTPPEKRPSHIGLRRYSAAEFLVTLILFFVSAPFVELFRNGLLLESALMTLVLVSGVLAVGKSRRSLVLAIVLVTPALLARWLYHLRTDVIPAEFYFASGVLFLIFLILRFLAFILHAPRVNSEVLCAGISTYLLLGLLWSFAYRIVSEIDPQAFVITVNGMPNEPIVGFNAIYFSLTTLCTVGPGDIVPVTNIARMLMAMEAITGTLYITVFIARLVALYTSQVSAAGAKEK